MATYELTVHQLLQRLAMDHETVTTRRSSASHWKTQPPPPPPPQPPLRKDSMDPLSQDIDNNLQHNHNHNHNPKNDSIRSAANHTSVTSPSPSSDWSACETDFTTYRTRDVLLPSSRQDVVDVDAVVTACARTKNCR
ncbi:uncharacterized protein SEPMUDRAFT_118116 [Sphaerulina musiva SO2202]|uniref:Uncharacterized protein n=1 Tax=Sphaerulina musiva (strain SO2202) TaxID=692275 RepID=N1QK36_SPHMS|nr:uncharacterized protein SEPMUDRAFT_118116 [Sphaerulina musiva SO2202]EMF12175.1 hypothetical protein SEPMUDRAFT_118116 [Sphaerulina musiva SO2202]